MLRMIYLAAFVAYAFLMVITIFGIPVLVLHVLYMLRGAAQRVKEAEATVIGSLMDGESVVAIGVSMRAYALFFRRPLIAITNSRVIYLKRPILGGLKLTDVQWKDVDHAEIEQNILPSLLGMQISMSHEFYKDDFSIHIPCDIAMAIYKDAEKQEPPWGEKHCISAMEEELASADGVYVASTR